MTHMYFMDTSILLDILDVPKHCTKQNKASKKKLTKILDDNSQKIAIPLAVIIETGNFINHIKNSNTRSICEKKFIDILNLLVNEDNNSWIFSDHEYELTDLNNIINKTNSLFPTKVGIGDAFIIESYERYCKKFADLKDPVERFPTEIWSYDDHINWYKNYSQNPQ